MKNKYDKEQIKSFESLYVKIKAIPGIRAGQVAAALNIQFEQFDIEPIKSESDFKTIIEIFEN